MKFKTAVSSLLVLLPLTVFAAPEGASGVIRITGKVVDSGCEVGYVRTLSSSEPRQVEVKPGLKVDVGTYRNACSQQSLPFSMTYQPLKTTTDKGIVTISYL